MNGRVVLISILIICGWASTALTQQTIGDEELAPTLKQQLAEAESRKTQLQIRLEELDEQLKPENIERAAAGIGSTHPEELREYRRKLLTIKREGTQKQLHLLEEDAAQIKAAIAAAEYAAYLMYALPSPTPPPVTSPSGTLRGAIGAKDPEAQSYNIPSANLKLKGTQQLIEVSSNDDGEYEFANIPAGDYTLEVSARGFKTVNKVVRVHTGETLIENIILKVGER